MGVYTIVDNRAWNSLKMVTDEFRNFTSIKQSSDKNRIELDAEKFGLSSIYSSYKIINKWMGRIYHFKWNCIVEDKELDNDISIHLTYAGRFFDKKEPRFQSKSFESLVSLLNQDNEVMDICKTMDFEKLELKYSKKTNCWHIEIWPNYGDFIWMLIPPVRYFRKPNSEEIKKTIKLFQLISQLIRSKKGSY